MSHGAKPGGGSPSFGPRPTASHEYESILLKVTVTNRSKSDIPIRKQTGPTSPRHRLRASRPGTTNVARRAKYPRAGRNRWQAADKALGLVEVSKSGVDNT